MVSFIERMVKFNRKKEGSQTEYKLTHLCAEKLVFISEVVAELVNPLLQLL